jgi:pimeloyl-ACP methyl ester carboxylesterase
LYRAPVTRQVCHRAHDFFIIETFIAAPISSVSLHAIEAYAMSTLKVNQDRRGKPVELFHEDVGTGAPVVLIHGWPMRQQMWENQIVAG